MLDDFLDKDEVMDIITQEIYFSRELINPLPRNFPSFKYWSKEIQERQTILEDQDAVNVMKFCGGIQIMSPTLHFPLEIISDLNIELESWKEEFLMDFKGYLENYGRKTNLDVGGRWRRD